MRSALVLLALTGPVLAQGDVIVVPGMGVELAQVDLELPPNQPVVNTCVGSLRADPVLLETLTGLGTGYLNLFLPRGHALTVPPRPRVRAGRWVVQNLRVQAHTSADHPAVLLAQGLSFPDQPRTTSIAFGLGVPNGTPVTSLPVLMLFSATPVMGRVDLAQRLGSIPPVVFPVLDQFELTQGDDDVECLPILSLPGVLEPPPPPNSLSANFWISLPNPSNVEAALNQCGPMSWANNLQYLEDTWGAVDQFSVPEPHVIGEDGDGSLVGTLDAFMNRNVTDRCIGGGTNRCTQGANDDPSRVLGLMDYLATRFGPGRIEMRHQGEEASFPGNCDGGHDFGIVSLQEGAVPTWEWMRDRIDEGYALSITYIRYGVQDCLYQSTGGHVLRVYEVGSTQGLRQITTVDDGWQDSLVANVCTPHEGLRDHEVWWLEDLDGDGFLNLSGDRHREIELAVALRIHGPPR